jgi:polyisoprenoid-binding protein YceI
VPAIETALPAGVWTLDLTHSSAAFRVRRLGVSMFRGTFESFDADLRIGDDGTATLSGTLRPDSVRVKDQNLYNRLLAVDFFDTENYPEIAFLSRSVQFADGELGAAGELTIKDQTRAVTAQGTFSGPAQTPGGSLRLGLSLEVVIERRDFGLSYDDRTPLGVAMVANQVEVMIDLEMAHSAG